MNIPGVVGIVVFYILILGVGIWAARKSKKQSQLATSHMTHTEDVMLAGRDIGLFVGVFTMTGRYPFPIGKTTSYKSGGRFLNPIGYIGASQLGVPLPAAGRCIIVIREPVANPNRLSIRCNK